MRILSTFAVTVSMLSLIPACDEKKAATKSVEAAKPAEVAKPEPGKPAEAAKPEPGKPAEAAAGGFTVKAKGTALPGRAVTGAVVGTDAGSKTVSIGIVLGCPSVANTCDALLPGGAFQVQGSALKPACPDYRFVTLAINMPGFKEFPKIAPGPLTKSASGPNAFVSVSGPKVETDNGQIYDAPFGELTAVSDTEISGKLKAASADGNTAVEGAFTAKVCKLPPK